MRTEADIYKLGVQIVEHEQDYRANPEKYLEEASEDYLEHQVELGNDRLGMLAWVLDMKQHEFRNQCEYRLAMQKTFIP